MIYNDDDEYKESSGFNEGDLDGFQIEGGEDFGEGLDAADEWLRERESQDSIESESGVDTSSNSYSQGMMTASDLMLARVDHLDQKVQKGVQLIIQGSMPGMDTLTQAAAAQHFGKIIEGDPLKWAERLRIDESVQAPRYSEDIATALSVLTTSADIYMKAGPGQKLPGNYLDSERQAKADEEMLEAMEIADRLAELYIHKNTIGSPIEETRRLATKEAIINRALYGVFHEDSKIVLPLPNETGVLGLVKTQGVYGTNQGTAEDRLSSSKYDMYYQTTAYGSFVRDERGYKVFKPDVSEELKKTILRNTPSLANTLFPKPNPKKGEKFSQEELDKHKRDQDYLVSMAQADALRMRHILRSQLLTNRDMDKGNTLSTVGWDRPVGDHADFMNNLNEAHILDIDGSKEPGSDVATDMSYFLEDGTKPFWDKTEDDETVEEKVLKQRSPEWYAIRKGKITASSAKDLLSKNGVSQAAIKLARERLGVSKERHSNADMREGIEGEAKALKSFLAGPGRGLIHKEIFFEENENLPGFGSSPDGRLYNPDGSSAGVLELKFLSSKSMETAASDYYNQLQLQMLIGGDKVGHFYALDKYTGEHVYETFGPDLPLQKKLIEAGNKALGLSAKLDAEGAEDLGRRIKSKRLNNKAVLNTEGQVEAFQATVKADEPIVAFVAPKTTKAKAAADPNEQAAARNAFLEGNRNLVFGESSGNDELSAMANFYRQQQKEAANSAQETSRSIKDLGNAAKEAAGSLGQIASAMLDANKSGMDTLTLAAKSGLSPENTRGLEFLLDKTGMSKGDITATLLSAGSQVAKYNEAGGAAERFAELAEKRAHIRAYNPDFNFDLLSPEAMSKMNPQQLIAWGKGEIDKQPNAELRNTLAELLSFPGLNVSSATSGELGTATRELDESAFRAFRESSSEVFQKFQEFKEDYIGQDDWTGTAAAALAVTATVAGGIGYAGHALKGILKGGKAAAGLGAKGAALVSAAKASSAGIGTKIASAANSVKGGLPMLVTAGARQLSDTEDDNSWQDSALDIAEFASTGALIGSFVGPVGTLGGAALGGLIGLGWEAEEYFDADKVVPDKGVNEVVQRAKEEKAQIINSKVDVRVEISPELVKTTVDDNGVITSDLEGTYITRGY